MHYILHKGAWGFQPLQVALALHFSIFTATLRTESSLPSPKAVASTTFPKAPAPRVFPVEGGKKCAYKMLCRKRLSSGPAHSLGEDVWWVGIPAEPRQDDTSLSQELVNVSGELYCEQRWDGRGHVQTQAHQLHTLEMQEEGHDPLSLPCSSGGLEGGCTLTFVTVEKGSRPG